MQNRRSLLVVTALGEELSPFLDAFQADFVPPIASDGAYRAYEARLSTAHGATLSLIFCSAYEKGAVPMAALLGWALSRFSPYYVALAGIAAGVPSSGVELGDILIAKRIVDLTEAKLVPDRDADHVRRMVATCHRELTTPLAAYVGRTNRRDVVLGTIISQPNVIKSARERDLAVRPVQKFFDELPIGVEMEGSGLVAAVSARPTPLQPSFVLIKGAVDFANVRKNDAVRAEASAKVADFLRSFLQGGWVIDPGDPVGDSTGTELFTAGGRPQNSMSERAKLCAELVGELERPSGSRIVWIHGFGGIGKTTLAKLLADDAEGGGTFAKRAIYRLEQPQEGSPWSPDGAAIVETFISQLGLAGFNEMPPLQRVERFFEIAQARPFLLTIDNLETQSDVAAIWALLSRVDGGSATRWIVTSRADPDPSLPLARSHRLEELSRDDSIAMMRELLKAKPTEQLRLYSQFFDPLYSVVGGNPLALGLAVGLLSRYPPDIVVDILRCGADSADELYRYIYRTAWSALGEDARNLLLAMRIAPIEGVDWSRLEALSGLELRALAGAVRQLCALNLLLVGGDPGARTYGIHRLTATFAEEVAGSWRLEEREAFEKAARRRDLFHTIDRLRAARPNE